MNCADTSDDKSFTKYPRYTRCCYGLWILFFLVTAQEKNENELCISIDRDYQSMIVIITMIYLHSSMGHMGIIAVRLTMLILRWNLLVPETTSKTAPLYSKSRGNQ